MVCHLHRSLYGLKQSPRCWNKELSCHLFQTGFQQSKADPCVFFQWKDGHLNIVSIYVDDLILVVDLASRLAVQTYTNMMIAQRVADLDLMAQLIASCSPGGSRRLVTKIYTIAGQLTASSYTITSQTYRTPPTKSDLKTPSPPTKIERSINYLGIQILTS